MANSLIGYNNQTDTAVLSGGGYQPTLPLTNLQQRRISKVARSLDATLPNTQFYVDLGSTVPVSRCFGLINHNFSLSAQYRVQASTDPFYTTTGSDFSLIGGATFNGSRITLPSLNAYAVSPLQNTVGAKTITFDIYSDSPTSIYIYEIVAPLYGPPPGVVYPPAPTLVNSTIQTLSFTNNVQGLNSEFVFYNINGAPINVYIQNIKITTNLNDTGWLPVWPSIYASTTLDWQSYNWWWGKPLASDLTGYNLSVINSWPGAILARYYSIQINDTTNAAGYIQIGRLFIGPAWQPIINMSYGTDFGVETNTVVNEALSGAEYFDKRTPYRTAKFTTDFLTDDQAFSGPFEVMRRSGLDAEVLFQYDPADTTQALRRQFVGRLSALNPISHSFLNINAVPWEVKELI